MRLAVICFLVLFSALNCQAQQTSPAASYLDSINRVNYKPSPYVLYRDSIARVKARAVFISDSLEKAVLFPNPERPNQFVDSVLNYRNKALEDFNFLHLPVRVKNTLMYGHNRQTRDPWVIIIIIGLLIYTAVLNRTLNKDFSNVLVAFYSKRVFGQVSKEDTLINSWAFIGLFLLFGFTFGLFLYQFSAYRNNYYSISGLQLFVSLSFIILIIFAAKFIILKFIGFVFNGNKIVSEYLSVLYLTYFNIAFVFLPVCVCFSLIDARLIPIVLYVALILIVIIFVWQYLRSSVNIISNFRFHKFYLIIYLCALEICPVLILIKALDI